MPNPVAIATGAARGIGAAIANAVAHIEAALGPIAALVNNAGIDVIKPFIDPTEYEWDRIIAVTMV